MTKLCLVQLGLMPIICHKNIYNITVNYNSWSGSTIRDLEGPGEGRDVDGYILRDNIETSCW